MSSFEGPNSVGGDLAIQDRDLGSTFRFTEIDRALDPWFAFKRQLNEDHGLQIQFGYQTLAQAASEGLGEDFAAGGLAEFLGSWTLFGRGTDNPGALYFRVEDRHRLGTAVSPANLGYEFGSIMQTGSTFSEFNVALTEFSWRQTIFDGRAQISVGKLSGTSWYNNHPLSSPKRGFQNQAFITSSSKPIVDRGLGAVAGFQLTDEIQLIGGIHDANAFAAWNPFDTIDEGEFFHSLEIRWNPSSNNKVGTLLRQLRVQAWHQDARVDAGFPEANGVTFAAGRLSDDKVMPFVMGGVSDGDASFLKADLTAGVGYGFESNGVIARDVLGAAMGWGDPSVPGLRDQYSSELFFRFQLSHNLAVTPSAQLIVNPASNPYHDAVLVLGLRGRLTF